LFFYNLIEYCAVESQIVPQAGLQPVPINPQSQSTTDNSQIGVCIQTPLGHLFQPTFSSPALNTAQVFTHVQPQYLVTSNRPTLTLGTQVPQVAYQTGPRATQFIIPSPNSNSITDNSLTASPLISTINPSLNQLVQIVAPNGHVMTTTVANLPNLGINTVPAVAGPYAAYQCANNVSTYAACRPQNQAINPQFMTNASGQIFALTPQIMSGVSSQSNSIMSDNSYHPSPQFIQVAPSTQVPGMPIVPNQVSNSTFQTLSPESDATRLHVQQIIEEQQQKINEQILEKKSNTSVTISRVTLPIKSAKSKPFIKDTKKVNQATQVSFSSNSVCNQNSTTGSAVSSTTSLTSNKIYDFEFSTSDQEDSNQSTPNLISVESQTLSSSSHSNLGYDMEPESTTQNTATVASMFTFNLYIQYGSLFDKAKLTLTFLSYRYNKQY